MTFCASQPSRAVCSDNAHQAFHACIGFDIGISLHPAGIRATVTATACSREALMRMCSSRAHFVQHSSIPKSTMARISYIEENDHPELAELLIKKKLEVNRGTPHGFECKVAPSRIRFVHS